MMDQIYKGWFSEISPMWEGVALSIEIEEHLLSKKTQYQQIDVFKTKNCGNMLVLDGIIQATELDEFAYQEMLTHVPMRSHPSPKNVLVIGGGDGGVLRELSRYSSVREIDICEIDIEVINASKEFMPGMACGFDDPRVNVHIADGSVFIRDRDSYYDIIIVDSSDPIGPGEALFESPFYEGLRMALAPGGIIATQAESFFLHPDTVRSLVGVCRDLFEYAFYSAMFIPTYPGGNIGICVASDTIDPRYPIGEEPEFVKNLRYYNSGIHSASFVLPQNGKKLL